MERGYSFVDWKSVDSEQRLLEGWATRVEPDRALDVVEPRGAVFKLPLPLLMDHDAKSAVGSVIEANVTDSGIRFKAKIAKLAEPSAIKDLCDSAWAAAKAGLRRAVSIGFLPLRAESLPSGGTRFLSWDWYELSMCSVPCAPGATIDQIKSFDRDLLRRKAVRVVRLERPLVTPRKALPVVRLGAVSVAKADPVRMAINGAIDEHMERQKAAEDERKLGKDGMLARALAAGALATDAELAALRERLDRLERGR